MSSPFFGLDIGVSGLLASQTMLNTSAHNVANANTPGYSRQRVTLVASAPYTYPGFNRYGLPGQLGTGVSVATVQRVRDAFLDMQIQGQTALKGEWDTRQEQLAKVEAVISEPSTSGLGSTIGKFWNAWQDVAADPTSTAARQALLEQSATLASQISRDAKQLRSISDSIDFQISQQVSQINDIARQLADLNGQIQRVQVSGDHPNDLMDQRDQLLVQLNELVPTAVVTQPDGSQTVLVGGTDLVANVHYRPVGTQLDASGHVSLVWPDGSPLDLETGQIRSLITVRDVDLAGYRQQLDQLASGIADAVNAVHERGIDANGAAGLPLFTYNAANAAESLALNPTVAADPRRIAAASTTGAPGDGTMAGQIADLRSAVSFVGGVAGTNLVGGTTLTTGGTARVRAISAGGASAGTYTISGSGTTLTLTSPDGTTQTINVSSMAAGATQELNFDQLGVKFTLVADQAGTGKDAAGIVSDLTAAGQNSIVVDSLFATPQTAADFYASLVGRIGADSKQATEMAANQQLVIDHLNQRQDQTSGVSLDEEATDMLRFQRAYQASARVITAMDAMLDVLINQTGHVGR